MQSEEVRMGYYGWLGYFFGITSIIANVMGAKEMIHPLIGIALGILAVILVIPILMPWRGGLGQRLPIPLLSAFLVVIVPAAAGFVLTVLQSSGMLSFIGFAIIPLAACIAFIWDDACSEQHFSV